MIARVVALLVLLALPTAVQAQSYVVQPGDSLSAIAARYGTSVGLLARANGLSNINIIQAGRALVIPQPMRRLSYRVQWGDNLTGIAARYRTSITVIRSLNPRLGAYPLAGQLLTVCNPCGSGGAAPATSLATAGPATAPSSGAVYVVRPGDTLTGIAVAYGVTPGAIATANSLSNLDLVPIGMRLAIPGGGGGASPAAAVYDPYTARTLITQYSYQYGVPLAMALGIGWEESGFNQTLVSSTGAIGVMQVEPYTGEHINWLLGTHFDLNNMDDNIHAGVYWLSVLLNYYGGDQRWAAAAYYQGTRSLAQHGWYIDTKQYVANVMSLERSFGG